MSELSDALLRALLSTVARQSFPERVLREIVSSRPAGQSQLAAYNMCDGTKTQSEIAKAHNIDPGSFSRTVARWIEAGIVFRIPDGREVKLLHIYPLPPETNAGREKGK